jgi:UDP-N-acetylglucosamine 2-epimerase (non-hydrolysing)
MYKISFIVGTRPEIIKIEPVLGEMRAISQDYQLISTGQQRDLCEKTFDELEILPDVDLDLMQMNQSPMSFLNNAQRSLSKLFESQTPDVLVVHGDTTTALAGAMVGFLNHIPIVHLEAGLRSKYINSPFPEEGNRRIIDTISSLHLAPTQMAIENLVSEGHASTSFLTGNSIVDAVALGIQRPHLPQPDLDLFISTGPYVFVTQHRRENFDTVLPGVVSTVKQLASNSNLRFIWPVHPNPSVNHFVRESLSSLKQVFLVEPLPYFLTLKLIKNAAVTVTDSGGIQEEAAILGTPLIITRRETERPEVLKIPTTFLVGDDMQLLAQKIIELGNLKSTRNAFDFKEFGELGASKQIVQKILGLKPF